MFAGKLRRKNRKPLSRRGVHPDGFRCWQESPGEKAVSRSRGVVCIGTVFDVGRGPTGSTTFPAIGQAQSRSVELVSAELIMNEGEPATPLAQSRWVELISADGYHDFSGNAAGFHKR